MDLRHILIPLITFAGGLLIGRWYYKPLPPPPPPSLAYMKTVKAPPKIDEDPDVELLKEAARNPQGLPTKSEKNKKKKAL